MSTPNNKKTLAIIGATGQQGTAIISHIFKTPSLSQAFQIRALTRDITSSQAQHLSAQYPSLNLVQADVTSPSSLHAALTGAHTIYAMTTPAFGPDAVTTEFQIGKTIADTAVAVRASYLLWSTLPHVSQISNGKYKAVTPFDAKALVEEYIRTLPIKAIFFSLGSFMENFVSASQTFLMPKLSPANDGTYIMRRHVSGESTMPLLAAGEDIGKFVALALRESERYVGRRIYCAERFYSLKEQCEILGKVTGKRIVYERIGREEFGEGVPWMKEVFTEGGSFNEEFGYFGPEGEKEVKWAVEEVERSGEKLVGFEEYLRGQEFVLE